MEYFCLCDILISPTDPWYNPPEKITKIAKKSSKTKVKVKIKSIYYLTDGNTRKED